MSTSLMVQTIDDKDYIFCRMCKVFKPIEAYHEDDDFVFQFCGDCLADDHKSEFDEFMECIKLLETIKQNKQDLEDVYKENKDIEEKLNKINKKLEEYFK